MQSTLAIKLFNKQTHGEIENKGKQKGQTSKLESKGKQTNKQTTLLHSFCCHPKRATIVAVLNVPDKVSILRYGFPQTQSLETEE